MIVAIQIQFKCMTIDARTRKNKKKQKGKEWQDAYSRRQGHGNRKGHIIMHRPSKEKMHILFSVFFGSIFLVVIVNFVVVFVLEFL
jgi:hypothetical protein